MLGDLHIHPISLSLFFVRFNSELKTTYLREDSRIDQRSDWNECEGQTAINRFCHMRTHNTHSSMHVSHKHTHTSNDKRSHVRSIQSSRMRTASQQTACTTHHYTTALTAHTHTHCQCLVSF